MDSLLTALRACAEPTRLRLLALACRGAFCVVELTEILGQSQPRLSRHLRLLVEAGVLDRMREGANTWFAVPPGPGLARDLVARLPAADPVLESDRRQAARVLAERARVASETFQRQGANWDEAKALGLPAEAITAALRRAIGPQPGRLLDIGTGTGQLLEAVADAVSFALGVDASRAMLALARARLSHPRFDRCAVRQADMSRLPLAEGSFDTVVLQMVLHHAEDPAAVLAEARRVLAPGGTLVVVDLLPHDRAELQDRLAHRWPGFGRGRARRRPGRDHFRRPAGANMARRRPRSRRTDTGKGACWPHAGKGDGMTRPALLDALRDRVLLCDGGMGSRVQALTLDVERDYWNRENCTEVLNLSRPDLVRDIHIGYFAAGADMVETNSFGGSPITLGEFDLADRTHEINQRAAELAREAADSFADGRDRWVLGSVGPGTKLPSLGNIAYDPLEAALAQQAAGLIAGGVDAILIETCQDTLQIKAAVNGAKIARAAAGAATPIFVQVTVETTGTLLVGPDIAAAATVVHALDVPLMGLNCATGPQEMAEHVRWLAANWPGLLSIQPNAGLPELVNGVTHYPLGAAEMASWVERFVPEEGWTLGGGCCAPASPTSRRWTPCCAGLLLKRGVNRAPLQSPGPTIGCLRWRACMGKRRCDRRTATSPSASAATPTARRSGASCRSARIGTAASLSGASRWARAPTASTSAPPLSAATRRRR